MSDRRGVTDALLEMLATTGLPIGDHKAPVEETGNPWASVYSIPGGAVLDDTLQADEYATDAVYQVTSGGRRRDQAEWMADLVRRTVIGREASGGFVVAWPSMTDLVVVDRQLWGGLGGVTTSGEAPLEVFSVAERYLIRLTRA